MFAQSSGTLGLMEKGAGPGVGVQGEDEEGRAGVGGLGENGALFVKWG